MKSKKIHDDELKKTLFSIVEPFALFQALQKNKINMMKIGGLINKEFNLDSESKNFLKNGTYLINGRSALLLILKEIKKKFDINKILVPYFACPSIIETIKYSKIKFDYYDYNLEKKILF